MDIWLGTHQTAVGTFHINDREKGGLWIKVQAKGGVDMVSWGAGGVISEIADLNKFLVDLNTRIGSVKALI